MTSLRRKIRASLDRRAVSRRRAKQRRIDAGDIAYAVSWARAHFNVVSDITSTFDLGVDYDRGEITVWPRLHGKQIAVTTFQLCREEDGRLIWKGINPLTGVPLVLEVPQ